MGKIFSRETSKKNAKRDSLKSKETQAGEESYEIYDPNKYDEEAVKRLKTEFKEDTETFILNQMLMCVMFFKDYQKDIKKIANAVNEKGKNISSELIQDHQKELLMPDSVFKRVNGKIKYQPSHGPRKGLLESLVSQRMYILHDTIEVEDKTTSVDYSRIDKPCYRAEMEQSVTHKGFVRLHVLNKEGRISNSSSSDTRQSSDSAVSTTSSKIYQENILLNQQMPSTSFAAPSNDSGLGIEAEYDYTSITIAKTPLKIEISEKNIYSNLNKLPSKCITPVKLKNDKVSDSESDDEDEIDNMKNQTFKEPDLFIVNYYINSTEFMLHFKNNVFPNTLGRLLDFRKESIEQATSIPGVIYCNTLDNVGNILEFEVIPAIAIPWPHNAIEWTYRRRITVLDKRDNVNIAYKWPTDKMIQEAKNLNSVIIPRGFMPKKGENAKMPLEWEISFPKAERYLEFRMSHAQMRIFLYLIIIHKTFIEEKTQKLGLLIEHIRFLMFWECEANYKAWPEDKLGVKLKMVLERLYEHLGRKSLPNYFIKDKNVFENVPGKYILPTLEILNYILESPVLYLIYALKHIKYMPSVIYPETNFDELYDIITSENVFEGDVQFSIIAQQQAQINAEMRRKNQNNSSENRDKQQNWNRRFLEKQRQNYTRKLINKGVDKVNKNLIPELRDTLDTIQLKTSIKKQFKDQPVRHRRLFIFFIQQFLQIAKISYTIASFNQTLFYLKQAWYLTKLLEDVDLDTALKLQEQINKEELNCQKKKVDEPQIPNIPKRNSNFYASKSSEVLHVKRNQIKLSKLNEAYISTHPTETNKPKVNIHQKKTPAQIQVQIHEPPIDFNNSKNEKKISESDLSKPKTTLRLLKFKKSSNSIHSINTSDSDEYESTDL